MLERKWKLIEHTYWEHYGAKPSVSMYETEEEAKKAAQDFLKFNCYEDVWVELYPSSKVVMTLDEKLLSQKRKLNAEKLEKDIYNSLHQVKGVWHHWDGSIEPVYTDPENWHLPQYFITKDGFKINIFELDYGEKIVCRDRTYNSTQKSLGDIFKNIMLADEESELIIEDIY